MPPAAELAAERGVCISLDAVSRARVPLTVIECASDVAAVDRAADAGLILDACRSYCIGDGMTAQIVANADMPARVEPGTETSIFAPILAALRAVGWTGLIEAELTPAQPGVSGEAKAMASPPTANSF